MKPLNIFIITSGNALNFLGANGEQRFSVEEPTKPAEPLIFPDIGELARAAGGVKLSGLATPAKAPALKMEHVTISTYRPSGLSGFAQGADAGVCARHNPTGLEVKSHEKRSQHLNRDTALTELTKLVQAHVAEQLTDSWVELFKVLADGEASVITKAQEAELAEEVNKLVAEITAPAGKPTGDVPGFEVQNEGWGTGWMAVPEQKIGLPACATLAGDQFGYVDAEAGTLICEDINDLNSRVAAELAKRGWTPPGMGASVQYPEIHRSNGTSYSHGWNECRLASMRLNQQSSNRAKQG